MSYRVELLVDESTYFSGGSVGYAFLKLTDNNGNVEYRGFYPDKTTLGAFTGYAKASIHTQDGTGDEDESKHEFTRGRIFDITKNQYDNMITEISNIQDRVDNGSTTYDLFDEDSVSSDFNCVTFANHILNAGGINIDIGILPQVALSSSYANEYGETYYDNLSVHAGDGKSPAMVSYSNGYVMYSNGSWEHYTTMPSYSITTIYNDSNNSLSVNTSQEINNKGFVNAFLNIAEQVNTSNVVINNVTFNITQTNNLTIRNAIQDIPTVSILLTHILIYPNEQLDLGSKGIYKVKSGDTLSQIAETYNYTTKQLLNYNTWLIDDGRVSFDQNKVLIETDANNLGVTNHTLKGTSAQDILKDHNGGADTLIGYGGSDILEGGEGNDTLISGVSTSNIEDGAMDILKGGNGNDTLYGADKDILYGGVDYDTYHVQGNSIISDDDKQGEVHFMGHLLSGGEKVSSRITLHVSLKKVA